MRRKKIVSAISMLLVTLLISGLLFSPGGSFGTAKAVTQSDIDSLKAQKAGLDAKQKDLASKIADLKSQQASYLDQKAALDQQNELTQEEIDNITAQITLYDALLTAKAKDLADAQAAEQVQEQRYKARVRAMEENGTVSYLDIIFQATSFSDLLSRIDSIQEVMKADQQLEANYIDAVNNVKTVQADYEASQTDAKAQESDLEAKKAQLESDIASATAFINDLQNNIDTANAAVTENQQAEAALDKQLAQQLAALAAQEAARQTTQPATGPGTAVQGMGALIWPVPSSNLVTSGFGPRIDPITGVNGVHTGWDIAGNEGAPIVAAASGTVVTAVYSSSYGNYVVIDHGNGLTTLYAHQSKMAVKAGDKVTQGETIGYVGATGWATGPHCHFEIRVNGAAVNPANYFAAGTYRKGPTF